MLASAGCALAHERGSEGGVPVPDGGVAVPDGGPSPGMTVSYVVSSIRTDSHDTTGERAFGVDIDLQQNGPPGRCDGQHDFRSPLTGATGVDNQLITLFTLIAGMGATEDDLLRSVVLSGEVLLGVQVSGVDSFTDDPSVTVHFARLRAADGTMLPIGSEGTLVGGGRYAVVEDLGAYVGRITGGRLETRTTAALRLLPLMRVMASLRVSHLDFSVAIAPTTLSGEMGGEVAVSELVDQLGAIGLPVDLMTIESVVPPDLEPDAAGVHCAGISLGAAVDAVSATIEGL